MKRLKIKNTFHKIIDGFDVNESSREVKYSNVKIDFTGKGIEDLPLKYQECQLVDGDFRHIDADDGQRIEGTNLQVNQGIEKLSELEYVKGQTSQSGTPTPSSPQPINITTGRQVVWTANNQLLPPNWHQGMISTSDGITITANNYWVYTPEFLDIHSYSNITVSFKENCKAIVFFYNESKTKVAQYQSFSNQSSYSYTIASNYYYMRIGYNLNGTAEATNPTTIYNHEPMVNKGTTALPYEKGNDYEINLGKQLFDISRLPSSAISYNNGFTLIKGTHRTETITLPNYCEAGTYTLSFDVSESTLSSVNKVGFWVQDNGTNILNAFDNANHKITFTATARFNRFYFFINNDQSNDATITLDNIQLEKGNYASSFSPYKTPIYLGEIRNQNNVIVGQDYIKKNTGTNMWNNTLEVAEYNSNGEKTTSTVWLVNTEIIQVQPNTKYTVSQSQHPIQYRVVYFNSNTYLSQVQNGINTTTGYTSYTFTTPNNCNGIYIQFRSTIERIATGTYNVNIADLTNIMLNKGETALPYEPYGAGQWYIHKEIGRVVFNGASSESWSILNVSTKCYKLSNFDNGNGTDTQTIYPMLSSHFLSNKQALVYSGTIGIQALGGTTKALYICFGSSSSISDVSALRTWLASNNVELYYVLNTPTNTLIEDEELINQLENVQLITGLNNINVSSAYLSGIIGLHYNFQVEQDIERVDEVIYTGYVNNYTLPKMKNKLEYRELDIDLLSPLALATLRTTDAVGTYNLRDLIREIIQPLIDDGFTLKELNVGNNQISVNYLTETIESSLNKLSNKFNFWWYIDKNKNIFINDISYIFNKNKVLTYDDNNKINGLIDFTPSMESIDYCNTIDFSNVRLFTYSYYKLYYRTIGGENIPYYTSYNAMFKKQILNPGDEITFDIPFVINTSKSGLTDTSYQTSDYCFKIEKKVGLTYPIAVQLLQDSNNQVIIPSNATISDSFNDSKEFVFVRDNFFKNLIVGMKYNGSSAITISEISSTTALMLTKLRISDNSEIEKNKDIISTTGIVEKQIDANEQWLTYDEVLEISKSLIGKNNVNVEKVALVMDSENDLKVGDIISIDKPGFLTFGDFIITDKKRRYYDNVDRWDYTLNNTNILESYVDLFRSTDEQENEEEKFSLITGNYINEGVIEKYEVDVQ